MGKYKPINTDKDTKNQSRQLDPNMIFFLTISGGGRFELMTSWPETDARQMLQLPLSLASMILL